MAKREELDNKEITENVSEQNVDAVYSKDELILAAEIAFNVKPEVVAAALKMASKTEATKEETKKIIKEFLEKEVK